jgi:hypothetical protein
MREKDLFAIAGIIESDLFLVFFNSQDFVTYCKLSLCSAVHKLMDVIPHPFGCAQGRL